jgi:hypothetical protein
LVALGSGSTRLRPKIWARFCRKMHFQELEPMVYIVGISLEKLQSISRPIKNLANI